MGRTFAVASSARDAQWIAIVTIEGSGDGTGARYKYCTQVPTYAAGDATYRDWLMDWPRASAERVDILGGLPSSGELSISILDYADTLTSEWRIEADPITYLATAAAGADPSITVDSAASISDGDLLFIGNECLTVDGAPAGAVVTVGRGKLDTDATSHDAGVPVYAFLPYLHQRRMRLFVVHSDAASASEEREIATYRIDQFEMTEDLNGYVLRGQSQLRWLSRLAGRRPLERYEIISFRGTDWQGSPVERPGNDYDATAFSGGTRWLMKNETTGELFSTSGDHDGVFYRGLYDSPIVEAQPGEIARRVYGADPLDDPDYPTTYFRWSPGGSPATTRGSGTWNKSAHWVDIILNLLVSSADPADGLELANRNDTYGAWDCLPIGLGIGVPHDEIEWSAALAVRTRTPGWTFPNFYIDGPEPFGDLITRHFLRPLGAYLSTVDGVARIILPRIPLVGQTSVAIGAAEILTRPVGRALYEHRISPRQDMSDAATQIVYTIGPREDVLQVNNPTWASNGYYAHEGRAIEIEAPSARAVAGRVPFLEQRALSRAFRARRPPWRIAPPVDASLYASGVGTSISITHEQLPDLSTGTRGWTSVPGEVTQTEWTLTPDEGHVYQWQAVSYGPNTRVGRIAPAARIVSMADGTGDILVTVTANRYAHSDAAGDLPTTDATGFTVGDMLELFSRAGVNLAPGETAKILSIAGNVIELNGDLGGALTNGTGNAGQILRYATSASAEAQQLDSFVYWSDGANRTIGATARRPWRYGEP